MDELKPCPFCGNAGVAVNPEAGCYAIDCESCSISLMSGPVGIGWYETEAGAITAWNTRAASGGLNEPFGNPEQLASLEQRARELPDAIRIPLDSLHADAGYLAGRVAIDGCTAPMVAEAIRKRVDEAKVAITAGLANQQGVGGAWLGTDIDSLRSIVLDETGCMVDLALYIASPNDGGPTIRQGRYDAACGFVDSTTGRRIDVDAWSAPSRALTQPAGDVGREGGNG